MTSTRRRSRGAVREPTHARLGTALAATEGLSVELGGRRVVSDATLAIHAGEVVALIGPNGAGKSTLLGAFSGDVRHHTGSVTVDNAPIASWSSTELALRRAVLPQSVTVSFPFTVREVVRMGRAPWARTRREDEDDAVIAEVMAATDIDALATRTYTSLSGGERARVALARVCAQRAQLLLLDEPTAALDVHHQELILALARTRADEGDGVMIVLHDLALAARHADRIVLLAAGRIVADGDPAEVFRPEQLSRVYDHEIEVLTHPRTGAILVVPRSGRPRRSCPASGNMPTSRDLLGIPNFDG